MPATNAVMMRMCRFVQCGGLTRRDLVDADGQVRDVAGDVGGAQDLRLTAERAAAQAVHLPQPILRHGDAEAELQVRRAWTRKCAARRRGPARSQPGR